MQCTPRRNFAPFNTSTLKDPSVRAGARDRSSRAPSPARPNISSSTPRFPDERTPIEATPLSATWVWDWIHCETLAHFSSHALPFFSPPSFHTLFLFPRSLVCGGQPSPHKPRLVVSHSTYPPQSSSTRKGRGREGEGREKGREERERERGREGEGEPQY